MDNKLNKDEIVPFQIDLYNKYPKDDMPISYDKNAVVLSRFDDDFWDFSSVIRGYETNSTLEPSFNILIAISLFLFSISDGFKDLILSSCSFI